MAALDNLLAGRGLFGLMGAQQDRQDQRALDQQAALTAQEQEQQAAALKPLLGQFGAETAKQVGGLLSNPATQALGQEQLAGLQQQRQGMDFTKAQRPPMTRAQEAALRLNKQTQHLANLQGAVKARNASVNELGDDIRSTMAPVTEIIQAGADIENLLESGTVLGGTAAAIRFAKASDPESSVREGELGTIMGNMTGLEGQFINAWNKAVNQPLNERTASDLMATTKALIGQRALDGLEQVAGFETLAREASIPENQIDAILKTARVNLPEMTRFALSAMSDEELAERAALWEQENQ